MASSIAIQEEPYQRNTCIDMDRNRCNCMAAIYLKNCGFSGDCKTNDDEYDDVDYCYIDFGLLLGAHYDCVDNYLLKMMKSINVDCCEDRSTCEHHHRHRIAGYSKVSYYLLH